MAALDYLKAKSLNAEQLPDGRLRVWPSERLDESTRQWIRQNKHSLLAEMASGRTAQNDDSDLRIAWLVLIDGKPARVVGSRQRSYAEVLRSVQARWPCYVVEVIR